MNKTIIININGFIFHIEEDAYEILKNYMTDVKRHFLNSADSLEITTDIENRIAEMFTEILAAENKQVIIEPDVKKVVEQMGSVADFESSEDEAKGAPHENYGYNVNSRKVFRDSEDHLVAGVCAGLAHYFEIPAIWVRLAFTFSVAFFGTGILIYVLLWIVVPKAITRADRMAMRGQKLNLQGFKENLEEELSAVRGHVADLHAEARPLVYKVRDFSGNLLSSVGWLLFRVLGAVIIVMCVCLMGFLTVALVALIGFGHFAPFTDIPYSILRHTYVKPVYISVFLMGFIPSLAILLATLRGIFKARAMSQATASTLFVVWICSVSVFVYCCTKIAANFTSSAAFSETISITPTPGNTYYLKLNDLKYLSAADSARLDIQSLQPNIKVTDDPYEYNDEEHFEYRRVHLDIERTDVTQPVLIKSYRARGRNYDEALKNARNIQYGFTQQDTVLKFNYRLHANNDDLWHDEELYLTLKLPLNAKVIIDERLENIVNNANINDCKHKNKRTNVAEAPFIITENGLQCKIDTAIIIANKKTQHMIDSIKNIAEEGNGLSDKQRHLLDSLNDEL